MFRTFNPYVTAAITALVVSAGLLSAMAQATQPPRPQQPLVEFDASGNLKQPVGYRHWVYVGAPLTPNDMNDGEATFPEFHSVYIDPESFAVYQKTGKFRDGTVIVKELLSVGSKEAPSGKGYFMGEFTGLEAAIKDSRRFKDEPGNWAYFSFGHSYPLKTEVAKQSTQACNDCHRKSAATDYVFTQYYPVLGAAFSRK
jgi:hypothetical protein